MKNKNVKLRKTVCRAIVFSPKIKTVKIGEMLRSKIVRRAFFSAEMKNPAVKLRENVCRAVLLFSLKHQLVKRGKVLRVKLSAGMKNVCCQVVKPSFAWPIWLQLTDGTICSCRLRASSLSSRTAVVAGYTACCQHGNGN